MTESFRYFTLDEFACKETGENEINPAFVGILDQMRERAGVPFIINSGYRSPKHSIEAAKEKPGAHTSGWACDIRATDSSTRFRIIHAAIAVGAKRIGIAEDFVHVDFWEDGPPGVCWLY